MARLEWLPDAKTDLERLFNFIKPLNAEAAHRAVMAIVEGVEPLSQLPELGRPWDPDPDFRELVIPFGARAYIVRYRHHADTVTIVRIWHGLENRS